MDNTAKDIHDITAKVQALLAKAESTDYGPEAEAFVAKAQDLISRYAIDPAALRRAEERGETAEHIVVDIAATHARARVTLLGAVAKANRCRLVWDGRLRKAHVFGFRSDLDAVAGLFATLSVVGARELLVEKRKVQHLTGYSASPFARNFWLGFGVRIGERLAEINRVAEEQAEPGVGLVLHDRSRRVADASRSAFPRTSTSSSRVTSGAGFRGGRAAADRANLSASIGGAGRRALAH